MNKIKLKKYDIIAAGIILAVSVVLFAILHFANIGGDFAVVRLDGEIIKTLPLSQDCYYSITVDSKTINTLTVSDGEVSVTYADCPDKQCKNHSAVSRVGESIICLPNRVSITIESNDESAKTDGVAG